MKRVLVTGGGGFIGKKVVEELLRRGYAVNVFDLIETDIKGADCKYTGSVLDPYELSRAMRGCDYVIHLAAVLGVQRTENNRLECLFINIQGTVNVLEACIKENIKKIIFASSSEVYGDQRRQPFIEDIQLQPKSNYAISKIVGEEYMRAYAVMYGLKYNVVRFFNVYGEDQKDFFVVPKFIQQVLSGKRPTVFGNGRQQRCFCYVDDAVQGIVKALIAPVHSQVFNIGNDREPVSMRELAQRVIKVSRKPLTPRIVPYAKSDRKKERDILKRIPSIEKAKRILKYRPTVSLDKGLRRILAFYEKNGVVKEQD